MAIISEIIKGSKIYNVINSSNIKKSEYDIEKKTMIVEFNNNMRYLYENVPHEIYTKFRLCRSQGAYFNSDISKKYKYKKL